MALSFEEQQLDAYRKLLRLHDWSFEFSDDTRVYWKGRHEQQQLLDLQKEFDPECVIWNELAPENYRRAP